MDKINLDINQLFRYLLSGGWALVCYFFINPSELEKIPKGMGVNLIILAMIIGSMVYVTYRSLFYPIWATIITRIVYKKTKKVPELEKNFERWALRYNKNSFSSKHIILWGSQVHLLFSSTFAGLLSVIFSNIIGGCVPHRCFWVLLSSGILFLAAMISSASLVLYDSKAKDMEDKFKHEAGNESENIFY